MRKWLVFLCAFFTVLSIITYNLHFNNETENVDIYKVNSDEVIIYDEIKSNRVIKLKIDGTNEIKEIDELDYLRCVVASEMPADYEYEALRAQAIVARTFLYKCIQDDREKAADICSGFHCQVYKDKDEIFRLWKNIKCWSDEKIEECWNRINSAVISTENLVVKYNGELIEAYFHASSPIRTESMDQIWGKKYYPYLVSVENKEKEDYSNRESEVEIEHRYFEDKIKEKLNSEFNLGDKQIKIASNTTSGRVNEIIVNGYLISAEDLRSIFGIKSTNFTVENGENSYKFKVIGYGHGVGMSQVGANYMAENNSTAEEIIKYYYTGVNVEKNY